MKTLFIIPARAGSKGLPGKNTKMLAGKPLISYSIDFALDNKTSEDEICISTDDMNVVSIAESKGIEVPFIRPQVLSTDTASSYDVLIHAVNFYKENSRSFDVVFLLQPTSPFRTKNDFTSMLNLYSSDLDMVVSVKLSKENPYFTLFEEDNEGNLIKCKNLNVNRRQDCPSVYAFNGSMYMINIDSLYKSQINEFKYIKKYLMPEERSIDIDTQADWVLSEYYLQKFNENSTHHT